MQHRDDIPREHLLNHAWVAYISPFSFVVPDGEDPMAVSLEEINTVTYNYGELCRIVEVFPIPIESVEGEFTMLVCYDGALAIPRYGKFALKEGICSIIRGEDASSRFSYEVDRSLKAFRGIRIPIEF